MGHSANFQAHSGDIVALLDQSPVLEISATELVRKTHEFIKGFPGRTTYAVKCNSDSSVVSVLAKAGIDTFDVASTEEMAVVRSVSPNARLHYHNPVRSRQEVAVALRAYGCQRFSVDHEDALEDIYRQVDDPSQIEVAIRLRMENKTDAVQSFKSKFGVTFFEAVELCKRALALGFKAGLTFHPGSQTTSPAAYTDHIREASRVHGATGNALTFLNVGGGFPARYRNLQCSPLTEYFSEIGRVFNEHFDAETVELECEPGRAIAASSGTLLTKVKTSRTDRKELFLNDGIYGGLMEFHQFPALQPHYSADEIAGELVDWTVYGPTCDPVDVLPAKIWLPADIREGDFVRFHGVGAYSTATATRFNGYGHVQVRLV